MMNRKLMMAAMMAATMAEIFQAPRGSRERRESSGPTPMPPPPARGTTAEDAAALANAEAKRQRKAAKRLGQKVGADSTALERPNVLADRREPIGEASSPKGDGRAAG